MQKTPSLFSLTLSVALFCTLQASAATLHPVQVDRFFVEPGEPATLRWRIDDRADDDQLGDTLKYTIRDYWGTSITSGVATVEGDAVRAVVTLDLGFHDIEFDGQLGRFGVVAVRPFDGQIDPFFAIDSAMSWLVRGDEVRAELIKILARSGIRMSRERVRWKSVNPTPGQWAWNADRDYEKLRLEHKKAGVEVLEMFHDSPDWPGMVGKYPDDLVATGDAWANIAVRWKSTWGALEIWNEPDISFGDNLPADQYTVLVEAIAWGLDRRELDVPLVGGSFAHCNEHYLDNAAENGLLDAIDIASFHTYARAPDMEPLVGRFRQWLADHGREAMPLWITECGRPWDRGSQRPPADQGAESAMDITMKAVEARVCGVARHFPFVYPYYEERENNFGMMGRRATPLRSMAAYVWMTASLSGRPYLGDLTTDDDTVRLARVFGGEDGQAVAVIYTGKSDGQATVRLGLRVVSVAGIDGRPLEVNEEGVVPVPDGLCYVRLDSTALVGRLREDTTAMRLAAVARREPPQRPAPSPILMRFQYDASVTAPESNGYRVSPEVVGKLPINVCVINLSDEAREVRLTPSVPADGQTVVRVAPRATADVAWRADLRVPFIETDRVKVRVFASCKGVTRISPLVIDLFGGATAEQQVARFPVRIGLPIEDPKRWTPMAPAGTKVELSTSPDGVWRLDVGFSSEDRWVFPRFDLPTEVDLSQATGFVFRARCEQPALVRVFLWEGDSGVGYLTQDRVIPPDGKWYPVMVRFDAFAQSTANTPDENGRLDLETVRRISFGMNSDVDVNALEVSDVFVVGPR